MKGLVLAIIISLLAGVSTNAQKSLVLNIHHKLDNADFALEQGAKNNLEHDFHVTRMEYYVSGISVVHDGGNVTEIKNTWILVNAEEQTTVELGEFEVEAIEKLRFHVGVDEPSNHSDPAGYPSGHPLAPQFPSMHWGWTAGYRFVAMEGFGGSNYDQLFQLHGLGDNNYLMAEIDLDLDTSGEEVVIDLDADYTRALEDILVNSGVIVHGDNLQAKECLENFRDHVFSQSSITSSIKQVKAQVGFEVFPNPVVNGFLTLKWESEELVSNVDLKLVSADGRIMRQMRSVSDGQTLDIGAITPGHYLVCLESEGKVIAVTNVIVK